MGASCLEVWDFVTSVWEPMRPGGLDVWDWKPLYGNPWGQVVKRCGIWYHCMGTHGNMLFRDVGFGTTVWEPMGASCLGLGATNVWELMGASCLEAWDFVTPVWEPMGPGGLDVWDLVPLYGKSWEQVV